jgi:hypothetical protein
MVWIEVPDSTATSRWAEWTNKRGFTYVWIIVGPQALCNTVDIGEWMKWSDTRRQRDPKWASLLTSVAIPPHPSVLYFYLIRLFQGILLEAYTSRISAVARQTANPFSPSICKNSEDYQWTLPWHQSPWSRCRCIRIVQSCLRLYKID